MVRELTRLQAFFYQTPVGRGPVREWRKGLSVADTRDFYVEGDRMCYSTAL